MKPPIKNILALEPSLQQKAALCLTISNRFRNGRKNNVQTDRKRNITDIFVFIIVENMWFFIMNIVTTFITSTIFFISYSSGSTFIRSSLKKSLRKLLYQSIR